MPIREVKGFKIGAPASENALERDASVIEMLYNLS
jgi:hypothetical protein